MNAGTFSLSLRRSGGVEVNMPSVEKLIGVNDDDVRRKQSLELLPKLYFRLSLVASGMKPGQNPEHANK